MVVIDAIGRSLAEGFGMFWETLWALVLGFGLSGAVQAFASRARMQAALGDHRPPTVAKASFFGAISSSCSYASSALAKSLFARGADFTAAIIFMMASTNLVLELGIVLWLLIGWQFALAEFVGGAIMIVLLAVLLPRIIPASWLGRARDDLNAGDRPAGGHDAHAEQGVNSDPDQASTTKRLRTKAGWSDAAGYTVSDLTMLRKELVIGFLIAGFLSKLVPNSFWRSIFLTGHGFASSLENVILGPFLAIISFVCSIGNVPLAAALWQGGISFGGVVSFIFADLITLPLLLIYRKYYGARITLRLLAVLWAVMSVGGLITEYLFRAVHIPDPARPTTIATTGVSLNYTTVLNIVALLAFAYLYYLYRNRDRFGGGAGYAKDVICGMQVQTDHAPATAPHDGHTFFFCSDRCHRKFISDPDKFATGHAVTAMPAADGDHVIDPVCGMGVDAAAPGALARHDGQTYLFCGQGCADAFMADPSKHLRREPATPGGG